RPSRRVDRVDQRGAPGLSPRGRLSLRGLSHRARPGARPGPPCRRAGQGARLSHGLPRELGRRRGSQTGGPPTAPSLTGSPARRAPALARLAATVAGLIGGTVRFFAAVSEEHRQVLRQQDVLVEEDLPAGDLPAALESPEHVFALADQEVGLRLDAIAIDD